MLGYEYRAAVFIWEYGGLKSVDLFGYIYDLQLVEPYERPEYRRSTTEFVTLSASSV